MSKLKIAVIISSTRPTRFGELPAKWILDKANERPEIQAEIVDLRESRSRPGQGIVTFLHRAYNQRGELVAHCRRSGLQLKRPAE